jgi:hypothetical protein
MQLSRTHLEVHVQVPEEGHGGGAVQRLQRVTHLDTGGGSCRASPTQVTERNTGRGHGLAREEELGIGRWEWG